MYLTTLGLVLRVSPYNETDAMLTILTERQGRISVKVRGLRRKNSPLAAACQLLAYGEFTLFEYKDCYTLNEANSITLFEPLRRDLQKLSLGTYFAQVADVISQEDFPNPELLPLILNCLYALSDLNYPEAKVKAVFELRAACLTGYMPELRCCHICADPSPQYMDITEGNLICQRCRNMQSEGIRIPLSSSTLDAMRYICSCAPKRIFSFQLPDEDTNQMSEITESYFSAQLERGFSSLDFYKSLLHQGILGVNHD